MDTYDEAFIARCRGCAEKLERYAATPQHGSSTHVPTDLLIESGGLVRGYEQAMMFYHYLGYVSERELLAALRLALVEFCSNRCPTVFKSPDEPRHCEPCLAIRATIAQAEGRGR